MQTRSFKTSVHKPVGDDTDAASIIYTVYVDATLEHYKGSRLKGIICDTFEEIVQYNYGSS